MSGTSSNNNLTRSAIAWALPGAWLALAAPLVACGADSSPTFEPDCPSPVPAGCRCTTGSPDCSPAASSAVASDPAPRAGAGAGTTTLTDGESMRTGVPPVGAGMTDMMPMEAPGSAREPAEPGGAPEAEVDAPQADASPPGGDPVGDDPVTDEPVDDPVVDDPAPPADAVGFVAEHGALRVQGNRLVDRQGQPLQLRGMSWFWSQWTDFYTPQNVDVMVDDWGATLVRAAVGVENDGGYLQDPGANVAKARAIVDRAIERGVYVIIDWHDHHAQDHAAQATAFFEEMVRDYGDQPNVIFEIYNEPMNVAWPVVKAYAEELVGKIRAAGTDNLIIVGTPTWSQDVDVAANDRITSDDNLAYALHFYANTHTQALRDKAQTALDRGIALFVTEWGTCSADGNGSISESETQAWLSFLQTHSISWANWALNNKAEACSAISPAGGSVGPWRDDQLTPSGRLVKRAIP